MLNGVVSKSNCVLLFVNQIRTNLGVTYGSSDVTPGGKALRFYASQRLDLRRIGSIKKGDEIVGNRVRIKGAKNKCAPPFKEQEVDILFDRGFDIVGNLIDAAVDAGIVKKSGAWYSLDDERLGQGKDAARDLLESNDELLQSVVTRLQL
jgi:recombination protein RecA